MRILTTSIPSYWLVTTDSTGNSLGKILTIRAMEKQ